MIGTEAKPPVVSNADCLIFEVDVYSIGEGSGIKTNLHLIHCEFSNLSEEAVVRIIHDLTMLVSDITGIPSESLLVQTVKTTEVIISSIKRSAT